MSKIISLATYLHGDSKMGAVGNVSSREILLDLLTTLEAQVFSGPACATLREEVRALRQDVPAYLDGGDFVPVRHRLHEILGAYQALMSATSLASALEMQKIVAMLSETLQVLAAGSHRSVLRLKEVEVLLTKVSGLDDIVALKSRLTDCLAFVRKETAREHEEVSQTLATVKEDFRKAQEALLFSSHAAPGRKAAEQHLARIIQSSPSAPWFVAVFVLQHFALVSRRYGSSVADQLLLELIRLRIQPFVKDGAVFRWAKDSVLAVLPDVGSLDKVQEEIRVSMSQPLDYRAPIGGRVAVLTIATRWMAWAAAGLPYDNIITTIDGFTESSDADDGN